MSGAEGWRRSANLMALAARARDSDGPVTRTHGGVGPSAREHRPGVRGGDPGGHLNL
jgi:hypothetical protein